jgi:hypothetical protein
MATDAEQKPLVKRIARVGLAAKGVVYVLLGALAFMAAFEVGSNSEASRSGALENIRETPGGMWLLGVLTAGLLCYSTWRVVQAVAPSNGEKKKPAKRMRYLFSALVYLSIAFTSIAILLHRHSSGEDKNQYLTAELLSKPFGQWMVGIAALIMAANGIYQLWYGLSERYKKHVQKLNSGSRAASLMLRAGKAGYVSRGIVWLIIAWLMIKAALHASSAEAGDTEKAFSFIEGLSYGSYLLGTLGIGLVAYGIFNFVRARYETFR